VTTVTPLAKRLSASRNFLSVTSKICILGIRFACHLNTRPGGFNGAGPSENSSESWADDLFSLARMWGFLSLKDNGARVNRYAASLSKKTAGDEPTVTF